MKILITPEDIIKRCLWNDFQYYILKEKDVDAYVKQNVEFTITEEDALVIGLLKVLETPNLVHRLKQQINNQLVLKSIKNDNKLYISKNTIVGLVENFRKNFPNSYESKDPNFSKGVQEVFVYAEALLKDIHDLQVFNITIKDLNYSCLSVMSLKKLIDPKTKHKEGV